MSSNATDLSVYAKSSSLCSRSQLSAGWMCPQRELYSIYWMTGRPLNNSLFTQIGCCHI